MSENRGSQENPDGDLTENRGLTDLLHQLSCQLGAAQQRGQRHKHRHHIMRAQVLHGLNLHEKREEFSRARSDLRFSGSSFVTQIPHYGKPRRSLLTSGW